MKKIIVLAAIWLLSFMAAASESDSSFVANVVKDETGFPGAVTVCETTANLGLGSVTVNIPYLDVHGKEKMGQGRLFVRRRDLESGQKVPIFCSAHYEKDLDGARYWCRQGWAVATAHYGDPAKGGYALEFAGGDSYLLAKALIQWVGRLPFIDRTRLHIDGGSAGGYMALAMGAENFPVAGVTADVPVINWAYNLNYVEANLGVTGYRKIKTAKESPTPVLFGVSPITDMAYGVFGKDLASETYYVLSPISYVDRITCPTMVMGATGDVLVPLEQILTGHEPAIPPGVFPDGYVRDLNILAPTDKTRHALDQLLPQDAFEVLGIPLPENLHEYQHDDVIEGAKKLESPAELDRPWSKDRQWSLVVLEEGAPIATSAHSRYYWNTVPNSFVEARRTNVPAPSILTPAKLAWLLQRYSGSLPVVPALADGTPANRLNFPGLEKRDVLTGLLAYARLSPEHEARLKSLYAQSNPRPLGDEMDAEKLESLLKQLP